MKYIDAEKLIAKIERRKNESRELAQEHKNSSLGNAAQTMANEDEEILSLIASLQKEQPSLPSNLDEAAEKIAWDIAPNHPDISWDGCFEKIKEGIKSGVEWMAGQGETHETEIIESVPYGGTKWKRCVKVWLDDQFQEKGNKVIVQIRKKQ